MTVTINFLPDRKTITAEVGEPLLSVAERAGVSIPTGCLTGYCRACEVEIEGDDDYRCACITSVPSGRGSLTIHLYEDSNW
jgi:ferredoxin